MPTRRNLNIALVSGFAAALCVGAGANKMISSLSSRPAAEAVGLLSPAGEICPAVSSSARMAYGLPLLVEVGAKAGEQVDCKSTDTPRLVNAGRGSLVDAIEWVESRGRADAVGDGGRAIGCLQIHRVMVDDCARLAPSERFTYADRLSPERSRAMFRVYQQHYNPTGDPERGARIWCAGPDGWKQAASLPYWHKVKRAMEEHR